MVFCPAEGKKTPLGSWKKKSLENWARGEVLKTLRTAVGQAKAADPRRCGRCLVTPGKPHVDACLKLEECKKIFCKGAGVPLVDPTQC